MERRLGSAARRIRTDHGLHLLDLATQAGVSQSAVSRFELGDGWRRDTNTLVAAYAAVAGITSEDLWRLAVDEPE